MGTFDTGFEEFFLTMEDLLPPPDHVLIPWTGIFPGEAHSPPYKKEMRDGVIANGYHEGVRFMKNEFTGNMGIWVTWMNVPNPGPTGSSPDFTRGRIIPNRLFPIHVEGQTFHNGQDFNPYLAYFDVPKLSDLGYPTYDGQSHFPVFIADTAAFGPPGIRLRGNYVYQLTLIDQDGNGWQVRANFAVAP